MTLLSLFQIESYNKEAYPISGRIYPPYFQIYFISVNVNVDDIAIIRSSQIHYFRSMKRQQTNRKRKIYNKKNNRSKKNGKNTCKF